MLSLIPLIVLGFFTSSVLGQENPTIVKNPLTNDDSMVVWQVMEYKNLDESSDPYNGKVHFGIDGDAGVQFFYNSLALGLIPFAFPPYSDIGGVDLLRVLPDGRLSLWIWGNERIIDVGYSPDSTSSELQLYKINPTMFGVKVVCYNDAKVVVKETNIAQTSIPQDMWALKIMTNYTGQPRDFAATMTKRYGSSNEPKTWGNKVKIYALDGMYNPDTMWSKEFPESSVSRFDPLGHEIEPEIFSHARDMALATKSSTYGMAQAAAYEEVRMTEMPNNYFFEKMFLRAIRRALLDTTVSNGYKVVVFHGRFHNPGLTNVKCASEILFRQGIAYIQPAGNGDDVVDDYNPFAFTVGAYCNGVPCPDMARGKFLHLWSPGILYSHNLYGTSIASGFAAAVAAAYISKKSALVGKPGLLYQMMRNTARTEATFTTTHDYAVASTNAKNRILSFNPNASAATTQDSRISNTAYKYCSAINIKSDLTVFSNAKAAMDELIKRSDAEWDAREYKGEDGYLVFSNSYSTTFSSTTKTF